MVPFTLYHGSSSRYLPTFRPGQPPGEWPHKEPALALLREAWAALQKLNCPPQWFANRVRDQESEHANWQHGDLYLTPNRLSAVRYAVSYGACGGELLTMCDSALNDLAALDRRGADRLRKSASALDVLLSGTGAPILVEFTNVLERDLASERAKGDVHRELSVVSGWSPETRELIGQQMNFRLRPGAGIIARVFNLKIENPTSPIGAFEIEEIHSSPLWG